MGTAGTVLGSYFQSRVGSVMPELLPEDRAFWPPIFRRGETRRLSQELTLTFDGTNDVFPCGRLREDLRDFLLESRPSTGQIVRCAAHA